MIHVRPDIRTVFVKGPHTGEEIAEAVKEATGKRFILSKWNVYGGEEQSGPNVVSCLAFDPPRVDDDQPEVSRRRIGYKA